MKPRYKLSRVLTGELAKEQLRCLATCTNYVEVEGAFFSMKNGGPWCWLGCSDGRVLELERLA